MDPAGSSSRAVVMPAKKSACPAAPAVSPAKKQVRAPSPAASPANKAVPSPAAWGRAPAAAGELAGVHVMGSEEYWPALSGEEAMPPVAVAPKSKASPAPAAPSPSQPARAASPAGNLAAKRTGAHGDRPAPSSCPLPAPERRGGAVPEPQVPAAHAPNHRSNGGAARHENGRLPPHRHHSRGGHNAGSGRRIDGGISIGNGNGNGNVNVNFNGHGNGGGVRCGQKHHGDFDSRQHRGRGRQGGRGPAHRQPGPQMPYVTDPHLYPHPQPHHFPVQQLPPPPFFAPPMPPLYGAYYGPVIGYAQTGFAPGWYVPPPPDAVHFVPYPAVLPVHAMLPHMEQQAAPPPPHMEEEQQEGQAHVEEPEPAQPSPRELEEKIRSQIEFYFSENNLCEDIYLKEQMDGQGWVPLTVIAGFNKVKGQTTDLELILHSLASSTEVEVQD